MTSSETLESLGPVGASLLRTLEVGRISPSYLFEGGDAERVRDAALAFAAEVLAFSASPALGEKVRRQVLREDYADLHIQGRDKATVISVAALSTLLAQAHSTPVAGRTQVFLIDPAEAMEAEGIARYLKALEEPPEGTVFLLVSTRPDRLPATVLSRVRRIRTPPAARDEIAARLEADGVEAETARAAARVGGGSIARARRMAAHHLLDVASDLAAAAALRVPDAARAVEGAVSTISREAAARAAQDEAGGPDRKREHVRRLLRDILHALAVGARDRTADRPDPWLAGVAPEQAYDLLEALGRLTAAVGQNVTPSVVLFETVSALRRATRA